MPYSTLFPGQEPDEKIVLILRRHWWVVFRMFFLYFILFLLPLLFNWVIKNYTHLTESNFGYAFFGLLCSLYYIYVLTFFFRAWVDYYLDVWIVTNERIVNIDQRGLFSRKISAHRLFRIQDVSSQVQGFLPTFLHFGDINVQTAGETPNFIFKQIPNSYEVTKKILALAKWKKQKMVEEGLSVEE